MSNSHEAGVFHNNDEEIIMVFDQRGLNLALDVAVKYILVKSKR